LKNSFGCPSCGQALRANVVGSWVVTFAVWTTVAAIIFALMPGEGFAAFVLRTTLSLLAGATVGGIVFGSLSRVASAFEISTR